MPINNMLNGINVDLKFRLKLPDELSSRWAYLDNLALNLFKSHELCSGGNVNVWEICPIFRYKSPELQV